MAACSVHRDGAAPGEASGSFSRFKRVFPTEPGRIAPRGDASRQVSAAGEKSFVWPCLFRVFDRQSSISQLARHSQVTHQGKNDPHNMPRLRRPTGPRRAAMCAVLDKIFDSIQFGLDEQSIPNLYDPDPGERVASWAYLLPASESKIFFHFRE